MKVGNSRTKSGFTIVELLIVIVVIGILAAITIVAFNGVQTRAENTKTITAVSSWAKALQLYKADVGTYPSQGSCLGSTTTYAGSYNGRCWNPDNSQWYVQTAFLNLLAPYIGGAPEPSTKNIHSSTTEQYKGALYIQSAANDSRIYANIIGISTTAECPAIGGLDPSFGGSVRSSGVSCYYRLPQ